jgi:hypothetical protein
MWFHGYITAIKLMIVGSGLADKGQEVIGQVKKIIVFLMLSADLHQDYCLRAIRLY